MSLHLQEKWIALNKNEYDAQVMRITLNILCSPILTDPVIFYFYYMKRAARNYLFSAEESQSNKFGKKMSSLKHFILNYVKYCICI